jgi:hypothetical protein
MSEGELKTFLVILNDQTSFKVKAHHFKFDARAKVCEFYKTEKDRDEDIFVLWSEVRAIIPD